MHGVPHGNGDGSGDSFFIFRAKGSGPGNADGLGFEELRGRGYEMEGPVKKFYDFIKAMCFKQVTYWKDSLHIIFVQSFQ
jgi:hypothetical protein